MHGSSLGNCNVLQISIMSQINAHARSPGITSESIASMACEHLSVASTGDCRNRFFFLLPLLLTCQRRLPLQTRALSEGRGRDAVTWFASSCKMARF
ncbi:hypothetical protein CEXT_778291 [Caerostris extrusa]|uniref:Uncharacterized protein n=1 Tax=Caerostris extrusa TaxID=172846 RepID=A0AAV4RB02_CAEEX|nr:hypothetical protein CEXT_778291 [Caerostris extrusa]